MGVGVEVSIQSNRTNMGGNGDSGDSDDASSSVFATPHPIITPGGPQMGVVQSSFNYHSIQNRPSGIYSLPVLNCPWGSSSGLAFIVMYIRWSGWVSDWIRLNSRYSIWTYTSRYGT